MEDPQQGEQVPFDGEVAGDEGAGQPELSGRPQDAPQHASTELTETVPIPSVGPRLLPSQKTKRTGTSVPTMASRRGARPAAALPGGWSSGRSGPTGPTAVAGPGPVPASVVVGGRLELDV